MFFHQKKKNSSIGLHFHSAELGMHARCAIYRSLPGSADSSVPDLSLGSESPWICLFSRPPLPLLLLASPFLLADQVRPQERWIHVLVSVSWESLQERGNLKFSWLLSCLISCERERLLWEKNFFFAFLFFMFHVGEDMVYWWIVLWDESWVVALLHFKEAGVLGMLRILNWIAELWLRSWLFHRRRNLRSRFHVVTEDT